MTDVQPGEPVLDPPVEPIEEQQEEQEFDAGGLPIASNSRDRANALQTKSEISAGTLNNTMMSPSVAK